MCCGKLHLCLVEGSSTVHNQGEMQILWVLPGDSAFRRSSADVVVRYLGDPGLVEKCWLIKPLKKRWPTKLHPIQLTSSERLSKQSDQE